MKEKRQRFRIAICLFLLFILFTICLREIDVQKVGPLHSKVGFATINQLIFNTVGVHPFWYHLTEILGLFPIIIMGYFAAYGFWQLLVRKKLSLIDKDILCLGFLYMVVAVCYIFFLKVVINYRPLLVEGQLEASYPSSHTILAITVLLSAFYVFQSGGRLRGENSFVFLSNSLIFDCSGKKCLRSSLGH